MRAPLSVQLRFSINIVDFSSAKEYIDFLKSVHICFLEKCQNCQKRIAQNSEVFMYCMLKTLERYQKCNFGAPKTNVSTREALGFLVENCEISAN